MRPKTPLFTVVKIVRDKKGHDSALFSVSKKFIAWSSQWALSFFQRAFPVVYYVIIFILYLNYKTLNSPIRSINPLQPIVIILLSPLLSCFMLPSIHLWSLPLHCVMIMLKRQKVWPFCQLKNIIWGFARISSSTATSLLLPSSNDSSINNDSNKYSHKRKHIRYIKNKGESSVWS